MVEYDDRTVCVQRKRKEGSGKHKRACIFFYLGLSVCVNVGCENKGGRGGGRRLKIDSLLIGWLVIWLVTKCK